MLDLESKEALDPISGDGADIVPAKKGCESILRIIGVLAIFYATELSGFRPSILLPRFEPIFRYAVESHCRIGFRTDGDRKGFMAPLLPYEALAPESFSLLFGVPDIGRSGAFDVIRPTVDRHIDPGVPIGATPTLSKGLLIEAEPRSESNRLCFTAQSPTLPSSLEALS
jgi:hypothetical protein